MLTFPVVNQYTASSGNRASAQGCIDNYNMTNDSTSTTSGVIIQRRPSVIKKVPKQEEAAGLEKECEMVDVVGLDEEVKDELVDKKDGLKTGEEEGATIKRKMESSIENGNRRSKKRREELSEKKDVDDAWKPTGRLGGVCMGRWVRLVSDSRMSVE